LKGIVEARRINWTFEYLSFFVNERFGKDFSNVSHFRLALSWWRCPEHATQIEKGFP
jgi:hypothetical protein